MATKTWDGGGSTAAWSEDANWSDNTQPATTDDLVFDNTSDDDSTADATRTIKSLDGDSGYDGKLTISSGVVLTVNGSFEPPEGAGDFTMLGATLILNASGTIGSIYDSYATSLSTLGLVTISAGATITTDNAGFVGVDVSNYGTCDFAAEFNIGRLSSSVPTKFRNKSTGSVTGTGTIVFSFGSQWLEQSGSVTCDAIGFFRTTSDAYFAPATYGCNSLWIYALAAPPSPIIRLPAGTFNLTGTGFFGTSSDSGDVDPVEYCRWDMTNAPIINAAQATVSFKYLSGREGEEGCVNGGGLFHFSNCNVFTPPRDTAVVLENLEFSGGTPELLTNDLKAVSLKISGGTFSGGGKDVWLRDDWHHTGGNYTAAGFAGATWEIGGCIRLHGTVGNVLSLNPGSAWDIVVHDNGLNTWVAEYTEIANLTFTGGTLQAVNCTNGGGNTGVNFTSTPQPSNAVLARFPVSPTAGSHTIEVTASGSSLTFREDAVSVGYAITSTVNQAGQKHGVYSFYSGGYTLCALDNFRAADPSQPPDAPTTLAVSATGLATWHASAGGTSYVLERSDDGGAYASIATVSLLYFQDTLVPGTTYDYRVKAVNGVGSSAYSGIVNLVVPNVVGYWALEEDGATAREDSTTNNHDMTALNAPGNDTGKQGDALALVRASSQGVYCANHSDFNSATSWSMWGWVNRNAQADFTSLTAFAKGDPFLAGAARGWRVYTENATGSLKFTAAPGGGGAYVTVTGGNLTAGTWYFLVVRYDASSGKIGLSKDGGAFSESAALTGGIANNAIDLTIGFARNGAGSTDHFDGLIDEVGFLAEAIDMTKVGQLYASGAGVTWPLPF